MRCLVGRKADGARGESVQHECREQEAKLKSNPMRAALERGELQLGTWINLIRNPAILPLLKAAGLDFARFDIEHSSPSMETVADMAVLARALDFALVVRPPRASREWITRVLDVGVWNLHCPQVETAQQAAEIVSAAYYAPLGLRGAAGPSPGNDYDTTGTELERRAFANNQVFVTVMLETDKAFDHLDEIAAMPGIHALTLGPADLAQDLGVFGTPGQGKVLDEKRDLIVAAARKQGKHCSMLVSSFEQAQQWKQAGVLLLAYASDVQMLLDGFKTNVGAIRGGKS
jgi:2-keto-3-deoxy-L-rhamnonate aldolase RhmA